MPLSSDAASDTIMVSDSNGQNQPVGGDTSPTDGAKPNSSVPKPKRLACVVCRRRKLKCDGVKPSCSTCSRLGHTCAYDEVRKKSGPKRGYVKALEERLKLVERLLNAQDIGATSPNSSNQSNPTPMTADSNAKQNQHPAATANFNVTDPSIGIASGRDMDRWRFNGESPQNVPRDDFNFNGNMAMNMNSMGSNFTWEMIGLGLEEPLPQQETIDELHQIYFEKVHPSVPMIHKFRYLTAMNLAPAQRPPVCLRYAMWTLACSVTDKYQDLKDLFYQRARKYVEADYVKGFGEQIISVAHAQTHVLLASYEFKMMYFPRAWMSTGSAVRLSQMIGLHRLDNAGLDVKQCLPPPRDWTEKEERRRTFWMAFCEDRYASIGTGWAMTINEKDILTNLPVSDEAYDLSRPEESQSLEEAMSPAGAGKLSSFGSVVLMACLFGRNLIHLHRPEADDRDHDLHGEFWKRHRNMDNILLNTSLCLPESLKVPGGLGDPNAIFTNMCIHTSTICLHQAAIFKADKHKLPTSVSSESKIRCITAANEIASVMRMISHLDLSAMNPFISFCLYVGARVFVQYLKSSPDDSQTADSLRFVLSAMIALKRRNPLTESFLVQLDVDLEALGTRIPKLKSAFPRSSDSPGPNLHSERGRKRCEHQAGVEGSGIKGIMAYHNDLNFVRRFDEDPSNPSETVDVDPSGVSKTPSSTGLGSQAWAAEQATTLSTSDGSAGPYVSLHNLIPLNGYPKAEVDSTSTHVSGGLSPDNPSTGPEQRHNLAPAHMSSSGGSPFEASPVPSDRNLGMPGPPTAPAAPEVGQQQGGGAGFFGGPAGPFSGIPPGVGAAATGMGPPGPGPGPGPGWPAGQNGMTPVAEGFFRSIMTMSAMDAMDLGWDGNP